MQDKGYQRMGFKTKTRIRNQGVNQQYGRIVEVAQDKFSVRRRIIGRPIIIMTND